MDWPQFETEFPQELKDLYNKTLDEHGPVSIQDKLSDLVTRHWPQHMEAINQSIAKLKGKIGEGTDKSAQYQPGEPEQMLQSRVRQGGSALAERVTSLIGSLANRVDLVSRPGGGQHGSPEMRPVIAALVQSGMIKKADISKMSRTAARAMLQLDDLWLEVLGLGGQRYRLAVKANPALEAQVSRIEAWQGWLLTVQGIAQGLEQWVYDGPRFVPWTPSGPVEPPPDFRV